MRVSPGGRSTSWSWNRSRYRATHSSCRSREGRRTCAAPKPSIYTRQTLRAVFFHSRPPRGLCTLHRQCRWLSARTSARVVRGHVFSHPCPWHTRGLRARTRTPATWPFSRRLGDSTPRSRTVAHESARLRTRAPPRFGPCALHKLPHPCSRGLARPRACGARMM